MRAAIFAAVAGAYPAHAATVYYSVGTSTADLKSGSPTMTISSGTATFSVAQPDNVGVGDVITYNTTSKAYVSARTSSTVYTVITVTGGTPADVTDATVNSIKRVFNSLSAAEANSSGASFLNTANLVTGGYQLNWVCYADGADTTQVTVDGYTTGASNYIRIYTPVSPAEVGVSQRHDGKWNTSAYSLQVGAQSSDNAILFVKDEHVRIEGLQIYRTAVNSSKENDAIWFGSGTSGASDYRVYNNILRGVTTASTFHSGVTLYDSGGSSSVLRMKNNVVYDFKGNANTAGFWLEDSQFTVYVYSNTVQNVYDAYYAPSGTVIVKNDIAQDTTNVGYNGTFNGASNYNISDDASDAPGANSKNSTTVSFVDKAGGDFHLSRSDTAAREAGTDLSSDANLAFSDDVDGRPRRAPWDIGADEVTRRVMVIGGRWHVGPPECGSLTMGLEHAEPFVIGRFTPSRAAVQ